MHADGRTVVRMQAYCEALRVFTFIVLFVVKDYVSVPEIVSRGRGIVTIGRIPACVPLCVGGRRVRTAGSEPLFVVIWTAFSKRSVWGAVNGITIKIAGAAILRRV